MTRIRVTIDQLTLKGFDPTQQKAVVEGLQAELSRVFAEQGASEAWARSSRTPALRLGPMAIEPGASGARKFGGGLARRVVAGAKP
ncbi:MAG TPA: hypothetical protein VKG63_16300 [Steroidobacteraceae bacterium]|nr:hypothetical protein [Steroidobacteraceae bacterium]